MADLWLAIVVSSAICAYIGYLFAIRTGRNPALWTWLGVALNILGLSLYSRKRMRR
jgi:ABC-type uncharacterized transport system permease subunit